MKDPSDRYVSLLIKSWAADECPPIDGRKRLLRGLQASRITYSSRRPVSIKMRSTFIHQIVLPWLFGDKWYGPYTQTKAWSFHLAADLRLLT